MITQRPMGSTTEENLSPTGLTRTETALLSPEEQRIRLRSRGLL